MSALTDATGNTVERRPRRRQPKIKQRYPPAVGLASPQKRNVRLTSAGGLEHKTLARTDQIVHPLQHDPSRGKRGAGLVERR